MPPPVRRALPVAAATLAAALATLVAGSGATAQESTAEDGSGGRAAVVVDTGTEVVSRCVRFDGPSISGLEALQAAGLAPVVRPFPGEGVAVCSLLGEGCPADDRCLRCEGGAYWAYHRAAGEGDALEYSDVGAAATEVVDGALEVWSFGLDGEPPDDVPTVCEVCDGETAVADRTAADRPEGAGDSSGSPWAAAAAATLALAGGLWWWRLRVRARG